MQHKVFEFDQNNSGLAQSYTFDCVCNWDGDICLLYFKSNEILHLALHLHLEFLFISASADCRRAVLTWDLKSCWDLELNIASMLSSICNHLDIPESVIGQIASVLEMRNIKCTS